MGDKRLSQDSNHGWWIALVLFLLAASFMFDVWGDRKVIRDQPLAREEFYSTRPVREPFAGAKTEAAGFEYNCNACHELMDPPEIPVKLIAEHEHIVMKHEQAMTCYTCHNRENREMLNDIYGTPVDFEHSENLCRRCHGPRFRDWKIGIHGRLLGYWHKVKGEAENITCVYCHNPHTPAFAPMKPSAPPTRQNFIIGPYGHETNQKSKDKGPRHE